MRIVRRRKGRANERIQILWLILLLQFTKKEQEQRSLLMSGDGFKKIIISKDALSPLYNEDGILVMSVLDFLLNQDALDI